uniref:RNA-dependent RNA polymerase n=1 Tax=Nanning Narna tick virus 1 TaxID=2972225 RepID=A0A9E7V1W2_9VIRU|nr:MAG: RNA-dependent RNA polymerase [Nanning Narna tick virus 1]
MKALDVERLDQIIEVLFITWVAIYGRELLRRRPYLRRILRSLDWLISTTAFSGAIHTIKTIKEWAGWCRSRALNGGDDKPPQRLSNVLLLKPPKRIRRKNATTVLLQASYVGRAMPIGGPELDKTALQEHYDDLRHYVPVSDEQACEMAKWATDFIKKNKLQTKMVTPHLDTTHGATLTSSRKEGGLSNDIFVLNSLVDKDTDTVRCPRTNLCILAPSLSNATEAPRELVFYPDECVGKEGNPIDYSGEPRIAQNAGTWDGHVNDYFLIKKCLDTVSTAYEQFKIPVVKREIVREMGYKVRIVTKAPATLQIAGKVVRKILLSAMRQWGPLKHVLRGDRYAAIRRITKLCPPATGVFVSTDLSRATDKVSIKAMLSLWIGLCRALKLNKTLEMVGLTCLGPVYIADEDVPGDLIELPDNVLSDTNYVDYRTVSASRITVNGILMGNPLTWLLLNVSQAWCVTQAWDRAIRESLLGKEWKTVNKKFIDHSYSVCGDDLIAYWPMPVARLYEIELGKLGFVTNVKKHYVSHIGGIFTEIPFLGVGRWHKEPLCQIVKSVTKSVTRVGLASMPYNIVTTARPDPTDPISRRLITVPNEIKRIHSTLKGTRFPGCFPIRGMLKSTSDHERATTIGETSKVLSKYCDKQRLTEVLRFVLRDHIKLLHSRGIVPEFPQSLGGAGYWFVNTARRKCKLHRRAVAALCYGLTSEMDGGVLSRKWQVPQRTSGWWAMAEENAQSDLHADSAFKLVSTANPENKPKIETGKLISRPIRGSVDPRDPEALTSISGLFGPRNPLDYCKREKVRVRTTGMELALADKDLVDFDSANGLYPPDRLVIELALEYERLFTIQMGPMTGGPGYRTSMARICGSLRKEFKRLVSDWPSAKPVTNHSKAITALLDRMNSVVATPSVYSYEPRVGKKEPALLGWHTSAARRGVYASLNWGKLLLDETNSQSED